MSKVIGRYKGKGSGNIYDFISPTSAIVVVCKAGGYTEGEVSHGFISCNNLGYYERVVTKNVLGGKLL